MIKYLFLDFAFLSNSEHTLKTKAGKLLNNIPFHTSRPVLTLWAQLNN